MRHKKTAISFLTSLALLSFGFSFTLRYQANHNIGHNSTTQVEEVLPTVHHNLQGIYSFYIKSDGINQLLRLSNHYLYLQSGTNLNNSNKTKYEHQMESQLASEHHGQKPSNKKLNKAWNSYIHENKTNNSQDHLILRIHKIINDKHKVIFTGYTQNDVPKRITLQKRSGHLIMNSKYSKSAYGLVHKINFKPITLTHAKSILNQDKLSTSYLGLDE